MLRKIKGTEVKAPERKLQYNKEVIAAGARTERLGDAGPVSVSAWPRGLTGRLFPLLCSVIPCLPPLLKRSLGTEGNFDHVPLFFTLPQAII